MDAAATMPLTLLVSMSVSQGASSSTWMCALRTGTPASAARRMT